MNARFKRLGKKRNLTADGRRGCYNKQQKIIIRLQRIYNFVLFHAITLSFDLVQMLVLIFFAFFYILQKNIHRKVKSPRGFFYGIYVNFECKEANLLGNHVENQPKESYGSPKI